MAYVFCLAGAFGIPDFLKFQLQGKVTQNKTYVPIIYPNFGIEDWRMEAGREMLDQALHDFIGPKTVVGHSMGARVINLWLHDYGQATPFPTNDVQFYCIGNSTRRYGGPLYKPENGCPVNTPYKVIDIARQYDGWADYPNDRSNSDAALNAIMGQQYIHTDYYGIDPDPDADGNYKYVEGNVSYVWNATYPLPKIQQYNPTKAMLGLMNLFPISAAAKGRDQLERPGIEAAYSRPVTIPPPSYA